MKTALALALSVAAAAAVPPADAPHPPPKPKIVSRADWGAPASGATELDSPKVRIIVHHTDVAVTAAEKALDAAHGWEASKAHALRVYRLHVDGNGWADIGYHYLIDWQGRVLQGRPFERMGAHSESHNAGSIGVALMGDLEHGEPTPAQLKALHDLTAWLSAEYRISPLFIQGHHEFNATACPGRSLEDDADANTPLRVLRLTLLAEQRVVLALTKAWNGLSGWATGAP